MAKDSIAPETQKEEEKNPVKKGSKKKFLIIGIALFLLLSVGASVLYFSPGLLPGGAESEGKNPKDQKQKEKAPEKAGRIYPLDPFIVNLVDAEVPRYLKLKMEIETNGAMAEGEMERRVPQLRDTIITVLSSKAYTEIYDSEGKKRLKEEIILKANQLGQSFKFKTVYFTEFVIQ
jgi:flagellar protein FliL